jgi:hypothetical protein
MPGFMLTFSALLFIFGSNGDMQSVDAVEPLSYGACMDVGSVTRCQDVNFDRMFVKSA